MNSMPAVATEGDTRALESLAPPCEYSRHHDRGTGPAVWILWLKPDCCDGFRFRLQCDGCWNWWRTRDALLCPCGNELLPSEILHSIERI